MTESFTKSFVSNINNEAVRPVVILPDENTRDYAGYNEYQRNHRQTTVLASEIHRRFLQTSKIPFIST